MDKKLLISVLVVLVLIGGVVLVWQKKAAQITPPDDPKEVRATETTTESPKFVTDVDPDVSHWQTKETEFFTIKFPKEWYWSEVAPGPEFTPDGIITNNPNHPIRYPEIEASNFNNNTEVVIGYELLFASAGDIVRIGVEDMTPVEGCKFLSDAKSVPIIKSCVQEYENHQVEQVYRVAYGSITISLDVRITDGTLVSQDTLEKIARSIVLTNKK